MEKPLHESATIGPYYFAPLGEPEADLILRPNLDAGVDEETDDPDDACAEPDFPDFGVLLYVERKTEGNLRRSARAVKSVPVVISVMGALLRGGRQGRTAPTLLPRERRRDDP